MPSRMIRRQARLFRSAGILAISASRTLRRQPEISARIRADTLAIMFGTGSVWPLPSAAVRQASTRAETLASLRSAIVMVIQDIVYIFQQTPNAQRRTPNIE